MVLLIPAKLKTLKKRNWFTFHYGSTYTKTSGCPWRVFYLFTFHYGSTYTNCSALMRSRFSSFTFHYGSTYTYSDREKYQNWKHIYIPLWFYLYFRRRRWNNPVSSFTFHYGSTYTTDEENIRSQVQYLHSTMVLLIPFCTSLSGEHWYNLHSTMVLLIQLHFYYYLVTLHIYIPLWFYLYCIRYFHQFATSSIYIPLWFYLYKHQFQPKQNVSDLHSTMVLLIQWQEPPYQWHFLIYIPLWFYLYCFLLWW